METIMKKGLTLVLILVISVNFSACSFLSHFMNTNSSSETNEPTEFKYEADTTYTFGDIEFDCSSILTLEDNDNGGTFLYDNPYISLSNYRLHSNGTVKLSTLYYIPEDAKYCESKDYYIQGCPAYKDSYAEFDEYGDNYYSTFAFSYNDYTYTFSCLTDYENKEICKEVIDSIENSLVLLEHKKTEDEDLPTVVATEHSTEKPSQTMYGTANNPVPLGETATIIPDEHTELEMSISNVISGDSAWEIIEPRNQFNKEPPNGYKYVMFDVNVKCVNTDLEDGFSINRVSFCAANDSKSVLTGTSNGILVYDNILKAVLFTGSSVEGTVVIEMPTDQTGYFVYEYHEKYFFFNPS